MNRYICIHGHFYQPPRENPWLNEVEVQESAYPYHDWNTRITAECYGRNAASRVLDEDKKIVEIINNYSRISFNLGPTLLSWLEKKEPEVYQAVLEADQISQKHFAGHGSAIAQVYNHMIMPLANSRDKKTQIFWGIKDFERRFRRFPEGMWLAETAVDVETLEILAAAGIKFTILAPHQAKAVRKSEAGAEWKFLNAERIDPKIPYLCRLPSGRAINIFFFDDYASRAVAFEGLLNSGVAFANRLLGAFAPSVEHPQLMHIATDGESYGHHHKFGDMALAYCLAHIEDNHLAAITIYGEYLEKFPPTHEVQIAEQTSWSCAHGIERWRGDCGCHISGQAGWTQKWRAPLREALDWLRDQLAVVYEVELGAYARDVWAVRDAYIEVVLDREEDHIERFFSAHMRTELSPDDKIKILRLLEMQTNALLMYTSCGWFFDEISGIETVQIIKYAARAIQLAREITPVDLETQFVRLLERAASNKSDIQSGANVYKTLVQPSVVNLLRVGAHYAMTSLFEEYPQEIQLYCYKVKSDFYDRREAGRLKIAVGRCAVKSDLTWRRQELSFAVLHFGDHNFIAGVDYFEDEKKFKNLHKQIMAAFLGSDIPDVIGIIHKHFGLQNYSLWHLFQHEQETILHRVLSSTTEEIEASFRHIYEHHYPLMQIKDDFKLPLPKILTTVVEFILFRDLCQELESDELNFERLENTVAEMKRWSFDKDKASLGYTAVRKIDRLMARLGQSPEDIACLKTAGRVLQNLEPLKLDMDLWKAQNIYFSIGRRVYAEKQQAAASSEQIREWIAAFDKLGDLLKVRMKK